ncbi:MAG: Plug domain-containing protein, partial [Muribaculaceae bacterium]|nr:Plug domain-containing protein [Muribaculaceae bacterium]
SVLAYILLISHPLYSRPVCDDIEIADTLQRTKSLNEVIVNGVGGKGNNKIGHISLSGAEINKRPALLGEHDVIKALQSTSGVVSGTEGLAGLYVRGGETDQNLYLLDGLPLLNVYHFGGLFSTFSTHSIDKVDFYKGNFPTLFSERASSIVDVALKRPDYYNTSGTFSVGLISGQVYFTTPLKKGTSALSVALRRTWFDVFSTPALAILNTTKKSEGKKIIFHYNFTDLMVKLSVTDRKRNDISFLLFYGKDNFKLGNEHFDPKKSKSVYQRDLNKMSWGNWGITLDYKLSLPIGNLKIQPYLSKAFASDKEENMDAIGNTGSFTAITETKPSVFQISMKETFNFPILHGL